jgi:hypothetical protein
MPNNGGYTKKKGVMKLSTLRKIDDLQTTIEEIPELSKPISILNIVKYSKQAYYNGNPVLRFTYFTGTKFYSWLRQKCH